MNVSIIFETVETVKEFIDQNRTFTAFDITSAVRQATDKSVTVYYEDVRVVLGELFVRGRMGGYTRRFVEQSYEGVYVYYPANAETPQSVGPLPKDVVPLLPIRETKVDEHLVPGKRGAMCVPAYMVRRMSAKPGDKVYLVKDWNQPVLFLDPRPIGEQVTSLTVDRSGNLRVYRNVLVKAGLVADVYAFEYRNGVISVRPSERHVPVLPEPAASAI